MILEFREEEDDDVLQDRIINLKQILCNVDPTLKCTTYYTIINNYTIYVKPVICYIIILLLANIRYRGSLNSCVLYRNVGILK